MVFAIKLVTMKSILFSVFVISILWQHIDLTQAKTIGKRYSCPGGNCFVETWSNQRCPGGRCGGGWSGGDYISHQTLPSPCSGRGCGGGGCSGGNCNPDNRLSNPCSGGRCGGGCLGGGCNSDNRLPTPCSGSRCGGGCLGGDCNSDNRLPIPCSGGICDGSTCSPCIRECTNRCSSSQCFNHCIKTCQCESSERCCDVLHPKNCFIEEDGNKRCVVRKHRECSDLCSSSVVSIQEGSNRGSSGCQFVQNYPYAYCGNYERHDCGQCFTCDGSYNPEKCRQQSQCSNSCRNVLPQPKLE